MLTYVNPLEKRAYDAIRRKILAGTLKPGQRLSEYGEAKDLGTSRGPVREAVSKLASEGLVEKIPGIGAFIRSPDTRELADAYEFREALESQAAALAAGRMTRAQLARLRETCDADAKVLKRLRATRAKDLSEEQAVAWAEADMEFHALIAAAARSQWIERHLHDARFLSRIWGQRPDVRVFDVPKVLGESFRQHKRIVASLGRGDAEAARQAMAHHIRATGAMFVKQMESLGGRGRPWPYERLLRRGH